MTSSHIDLERNLLAAPAEAHRRVEIYSGVARLARAVWASEVKPVDQRPATAVVFCHPTANFLGHYALMGLAERGFGAIGLTTRYVGNDTALILENCLLDIGAMVAHLRGLGYQRVVLVGNSGGASIVPYYQAQAQAPTVADPPGGGPDLTEAGLPAVDGLVMLMAHPSRARLSSEWLDPAIADELQPFERDPLLDMFDSRNGPPYSPEFVERYRGAQLARNRRISAWAESRLRTLTDEGHVPRLDDLAFVVHGTAADLRFLDGSIDPSDRQVGVTLWGPPATANYMPAGISRTTTLRSWLNQWSVDHTNGDSLRWLPDVEVPVLIEYGTADPTVHPHMGQQMYDATTKAPRELVAIAGANHYFEGQPELLDRALDALAGWAERLQAPGHRMAERHWPTGTDVVHVTVRDGVAVITLNRPERRNALHHDMYAPIARALDEFVDAPDVGCIVLTGAGSAFCAGGDVRAGRGDRAGPDAVRPTDDERQAALVADARIAVALHEHPRITMAAVNGPAIGAGLALALACDLRIAAASARFVTGWARLALSGDFGGAWFLTRLVGPAVALELLASNAALTAEEAAGRGLVNRVVPDDEFADAWFAWARSFADGPQEAMAAMKRNVADAVGLPLAEALPREAARNVATSGTAEHRQAVRAWLDGRPPRPHPPA